MDDVVGGVTLALKRSGVYHNTIILISSDNGPWFDGSPGYSRGRKSDSFDGGMHVPMIIHWPAKFQQGKTMDGLSMGIDWFPTLLDWLEIPLPTDRIIDGESIAAMLEKEQPSPHEYLYAFVGDNLEAVRSARYKYHNNLSLVYTGGVMPIGVRVPRGPALFDYDSDHNESYNIVMNSPALAAQMKQAFDRKKQEFLDNKRGWLGQ